MTMPDEQLRAVALDAMPDPVVLLEPIAEESGAVVDLRFALVNSAASDYLQRERDDLVGRSLAETLPAETVRALIPLCAPVAADRRPVSLSEHELGGSDGGKGRLFDLRIWPADGLVGVTWRDVTDEHRAAAELAASEHRYRLLAENATDVVVQVGPDGTAVWISPAIEACLGWTAQELLGTALVDLMHPEDAAEARALQARLLAGEDVADIPVSAKQFRCKDGRYRWMVGHGSPLRDRDGQPSGVVYGLSLADDLVHARQDAEAGRAWSRTLLDTMAEGVMVYGPDGRVVDVNPAAERIVGMTAEQMAGKQVASPRIRNIRSDGSSLPDEQNPVTLCLTTGEPVRDAVVGMYRLDGSLVWIQSSVEPLTVPGSGPAGVVATFADVTDRVRSEQALAASEAQLRTLTENTRDVVVMADPDGTMTYVSPAVGRVLGWQPADLIGHRVGEFVHPDDLPIVQQVSQTAMTGQGATATARLRCPDGSYLWIESAVSAVLLPDGTPGARTAVWRDVTERVQAQARLTESEARYRLLAENAADVVVATDPDGVLTYVSPAVTRVLGWAPEDLMDTELWNLVHPDDVAQAAAAAQILREDVGSAAAVRARLRCADGSYRWISSSGGYRLADNGAVVGGVATWRDVTSEVAAQQALAASEELFRTAMYSSAVGICLVAPDGAFLRVNPALCRILGRDEAALTASTWQDLTHPDDVDADQGLVDDVLAGRRDSYRLRKRYLRPDGSVVYADLAVGCVRDTDGEVQHFVSQIVDVTAEHAQQQELAAERARLAAVLDSELEPHVYLEAVRDDAGGIVDFVYRDANDAACAYMQMARADLEGARVLDLLPGQAGSGMLAMYAAAVDSGQPLALDDYAYPHEILAGERRYDIRAAKVGDGLSFAWRDVTERHEAAVSLQQSREEFRLLAENAADVVLLFNAHDEMTWVSPAAHRLLGYEPDALLGATRTELVHPFDLAKAQTAMATLRSGHALTATEEVRLRRRDGLYTWWQATGRRTDDDPATADVVLALRDIDAEVRARATAEEERDRRASVVESMLDPNLLLRALHGSRGTVSDFTVEDVNHAACAALGIAFDRLVGARFSDLAPAAVPEILSLLVDTVTTGTPLSLDNATFPGPEEGLQIWADLRAVRLGVDRASLTWRDVTDRQIGIRALAASEERFRMLAENATDMVALADNNAVLRWFSPSISALGWTPEEVVGRRATELLHPDDQHRLLEGQQDQAGTSPFVECRVRQKSGGWRWYRVRVRPVVSDDGTVTGQVSGWQDIHAEKEARDALVASEARFRMLADNIGDVLIELDLDGNLTYVSGAMTDVLGWRSDDLLGSSLLDLVHPDDRNSVTAAEHISHEAPDGIAAARARMERADGTFPWMGGVIREVRNPDGTALFAVATLRDIHAEVLAETDLQKQAATDALTGLINRRELIKRVEGVLQRRPRTGQNVGVLFVDLDRLKPINDTYGHAAGDAVITAVARRMHEALRADDLVARIGGDEFVAVLTTIGSLDDAASVAEKIRTHVSQPVDSDGTTGIPVSISIGLALVHPGDDPDTAINRADTALYRAKRQGGNRTAIYEGGNGG